MQTKQILSIPIHRLKPDSKQPRRTFPRESLEHLGESLKVRQEQPIRVRPEGEDFIIVHGERRYRAAVLAGMAVLDAIVDTDPMADATRLERQIADNAGREDLPPLEFALALQEWIAATNRPASEIAKRIGASPAHVSRALKLLTLPGPIQDDLRAGRISASAAYALAGVADPAVQEELANEASSGKLTRDAIYRKIKRVQRKAPTTKIERFSAKLGERRSVTIKGPNISMNFLVAWFAHVLEQAKTAQQNGMSMQEFATTLHHQGLK